jgi:hypothetical protein
MAGSVVGCGGTALMLHVVYKGCALPLAWRVRHGPQGHFPEERHIALVELVRACLPEGTPVVLLGDGEPFRLDTLGACSKPGTLIELKEVKLTRDAYGPVMVLSCWAKRYHEPLYVVSTMDTAEEAGRYYQKRFRIETFCSDQKSRWFHIHKSHIADPQRLSRLLIAACLAYIWIVYLGALCEKDWWREIIHRRKRCDLNLF